MCAFGLAKRTNKMQISYNQQFAKLQEMAILRATSFLRLNTLSIWMNEKCDCKQKGKYAYKL